MNRAACICHNGEFKRLSESGLFANNRAFRFGDAIFENIHAYATESQFLHYHFERMVNGMKMLMMEIPSFFTTENFQRLITQLLIKNQIYGGALIRLTVYREKGESYSPVDNHVSYILESQKLERNFYELNERGLVIDLFTEFPKPANLLSSVKSTNALLYVLASLYNHKRNLDDSILLNEDGRIVESVNSNLFLVSGSSIFTPGLDQWCLPGVMRRVIIDIACKSDYKVNDQCSLTPAALDDADEIFLTNVTEGIKWVGAFRQRRYYKKTAQQLIRKLNELAFNR
jgi:branched-subunit amino acid aminotransferase/4-amino-4-deoxychorismate lyase